MKVRMIMAAAAALLTCGTALAAGVHEGLAEYPMGKKIAQVKQILPAGTVSMMDVCATPALRTLYGKHDVACDAIVSSEPVKIGEILFYPEFAMSDRTDRVVAVIYRSAHQFASKKKRDLEMSSKELEAAATDRDYMIARNNTFRAIGDVAKLAGRNEQTLQPGLRVVKYYFEGVQDRIIFREHTTEEEDRVTIVAMPRALGDERRVFLTADEEKRFFGQP